MWEYSEKVKDHFFNPRNVGKIEDADAVGEVGSIACGDALRLYLKLDENKKIVDARFETFGCGSAIAAASALTEMIKGKTIDEAIKITNKDIAEFLDGLPPEKMHCSVMGREALEAAVANYYGLERKHIDQEDEGKIVCHCFGVTEGLIRKVVKENNLQTVEDVTNYCKAGGGCGSCHIEIEEIIREVQREKEQKKQIVVQTEIKASHMAGKKMSNVEKILKIKEVIDEEIRPLLQRDGGDVELIDVEGDKVFVSMRGMCASCPSSTLTIKTAIESKLREFVSENITVEEVR